MFGLLPGAVVGGLAACLGLGEVAQREQRARQLALAQVRQEVGLVLDGVRGQRQPGLVPLVLLLLLLALLLLLLLLLLHSNAGQTSEA